MSSTSELLGNAERHAAEVGGTGLSARPARRLAILTCMDARFDPVSVLGLAIGDAHVIRNAGGLATDDAVRSLLLSQRALGTEEILVIHHTGCGLERLDEAAFLDALTAEVGSRPPFSLGSFDDVSRDARETADRLAESPFLDGSAVRCFVFDVATGQLDEVPRS